jgi:hypothetical protein
MFGRHEFLEGVNKIPIEKFQIALRVAKLAIDKDECECIVANLIYQVFIIIIIAFSIIMRLFTIISIFKIFITYLLVTNFFNYS